MPISKRRKTEQGEGNCGEKEKNSKSSTDTKDALNEEKQIKIEVKIEPSEGKQKPQAKADPVEQATAETSKVARIGAVTRSRVVRKPRRNLSPPPSPTKKPAKEPKTTTPETKQKRQWELWSVDDKDAFFEGLFEAGKDFEVIQSFLVQKCKKKGLNPSVVKNKDQVRHFYYRTWHKISKFITPAPEVKKESQELYGLINYGILRKRIKGLNEKTGAKLNDLVHNGFTTVKIRGKNLRIKTPVCLALKKLNNIDTSDHKWNPADRIPNKIEVEINPKTNAAWRHVQDLSFNPRLKLVLKPDRTLSSVLSYLSRKWRSQTCKLRENLCADTEEPAPVLTVYPHPDSDIIPLSLHAIKEPKINITFNDYKENILNSPTISREKKCDNTKTVSTISTLCSENSHSMDFMDAKNGMFESPKSRLTSCSTKDSKLLCTPTSAVSYSMDAAFLSEGENAMFPDTPLSKADSKSTENLTETESTDGSPPRKKHLSGGNESEAVKTSSDNEEKCVDSIKQEQEFLNVKDALEKGWNSTSAENLTIAQMFLMFGKDQKIKLEYDFCKETTVEDIVKSQLTNTLRRLVHLAVMEMTEVKGTSSSLSPCQSCGTVRSKVKGCGKGQKAGVKNPFCSKDGLVDVGVQTTFKFKESNNSSQTKEAVFKIPVMGASFLQKNTAPPGSASLTRSINQAIGSLAPSYRNGRKIKQINRKPMVVQRQILPKATNLFTIVNGPNSVINVPNSQMQVQPNPSAIPVCTTVPCVNNGPQMQQPTMTLDPSQLNIQSPQNPSQIVPTQTMTLGPEQLPVKINPTQIPQAVSGLTVPSCIFTTTSATNQEPLVTTVSSGQSSLSPPSISSLLDMSFSNFGTPGGDGEKLFEIALSAGPSYDPLIDGTPVQQKTSSVISCTTPETSLMSTPVSYPTTTSWINGDVGDVSFMSLLNESAKPEPTVQTTTLQPQALFFDNSRDSSIMGKFDVDTLMNESSMDFAAKFADLQALTQEDSMDLAKKNLSNG